MKIITSCSPTCEAKEHESTSRDDTVHLIQDLTNHSISETGPAPSAICPITKFVRLWYKDFMCYYAIY